MARLVVVVVLLASGCVWEDRCAGGAVRDEATGACRAAQADAGRDAEVGTDAGTDGGVDAGSDGGADAGSDGGQPDGGTDAGPPPTIVELAVGIAHACVVDSNGRLVCWGANGMGQLATGDVLPQSDPLQIDLGARVNGVSSSSLHVCAYTAAPALHCWASNGAGQIGNGTASPAPVTSPYRNDALGAARHVAASFANTCFTDGLGSTTCWGRNDFGQLAVGMVSVDVSSPGVGVQTSSGTLENVVATAIGDRHACFLDSSGALWCAGRNSEGECGLTGPSSVLFATEVPGMTEVTSVAAGSGHTCAVHAGVVYCWGSNDAGQVQPGAPPDPISAPTSVAGLGAATRVVAGASHTCAVLLTGQVACWGSRSHGALGDGMPVSDTSVAAPVMVSGLTDVDGLEASFEHLVCALTRAGQLYCWGEDGVTLLGGIEKGAQSVFLDGETIHPAPVLVDPFR